MNADHILRTGEVTVHPVLGEVRIVVRKTSRKISIKWNKGQLVCNVPPGVTMRYIMELLDNRALALSKLRPSLTFTEGSMPGLYGWTVRIARCQLKNTSGMTASFSATDVVLLIPQSFDFACHAHIEQLNRFICRIAARLAPAVLIPEARRIADRLSVSPDSWKISSGHYTLGTCSAKRVISLSYMNMFLPPHLRAYIICHELAHLTEMNHSPRFHQLCDRYCGGNEKRLIAELKSYRWPVIR